VAEAILLVGGKGTRLRPLTVYTPKPMLEVAGVPFLSHQIARAKAAGVDRIVFATAYKPEVFEEYFGDGERFGVELEYVTETVALGTGGAIRNVADRLVSGPDEPVLVFNGDILSGVDLVALLAAHRDRDADVTLHLTRVPRERLSAFGQVPTDAEGWVTEFREKPQRPEEFDITDQINAGCYVFRRSVIDTIPTGRPISVERETFPGLVASGAKVLGVVEETYWRDLGTPDAFVQGSADLVLGAIDSTAIPPSALPAQPDALVLDGAHIAADAKLAAGCTVGAGARIAAGATVHGSVVGENALVGENAVVVNSIVGRGARIGAQTHLDGVVVGDGATVGARNELKSGMRVWCDSTIPDAAVRFSSDES
jgi:mannose-1-phosphate guanylyltransferase